jgi:hypothetical protein
VAFREPTVSSGTYDVFGGLSESASPEQRAETAEFRFARAFRAPIIDTVTCSAGFKRAQTRKKIMPTVNKRIQR